MTLVGRPDDAAEHLLGVRAVATAIAAADLPGDDGGPDGLLGAPIGGVDRRVPKESEHRGEFDGQMSGESFGRLQRRRLGDQSSESGEQSAAGGCQTMVAQTPRIAPITQLKSGLQDSFHPDGPPATWVVALQVPCPPQQVSQTCLVQRLGEAAIRRSPVADQHPRELRPAHRRRIVEAAPRTNRIDRRRRCGVGPQPVAPGADALAGLVRCDHGAVPHLPAQPRVGRGRSTSRAVHHVDEASPRDRNPEFGPQQLRDLLKGHAQLCVHPHDQCDGRRTQLHARVSQPIGGLHSVAALGPTSTPRALADLDVEASHEAPHLPKFQSSQISPLPPPG